MSLADNDINFSILIHSPLLGAQAYGENLISNPDFETAGGGGADVFASWTEDTDTGNATITRASTTPDPHSGTYYCEIYSVNGGDVSGNVSQDITGLTPGDQYHLTVWSRTSANYASMQGRWAIYDNTNSAWIVSRENVGCFASTLWQQASLFFTIPAGCSSIKIYLYQNFDSDSYVYYDLIEMRPVKRNDPGFLWDYFDRVNSYSHTTSVNLGYDTMQFSTAGTLTTVGDWLQNGLGRHIVVREGATGIIWEGFVNEVSMQAGGFSMKVGPMKDMVNRGRVTYNQLDWNTTPPVGGDTVMSRWLDQSNSQSIFGMLEGTISGGEGTEEEMDTLLNTLLGEMAWLQTSSNFSVGRGSGFTLNISCLGYGHLLDKYYYSNTGIAGEYDASDKIRHVLDRCPNTIYDYTLPGTIIPNDVQVEYYEDGEKTALSILKETANLGSTDYVRHIFGVYDDRTFIYEEVPSETTYRTEASDGRVRSASGAFLNPWQIKPGRWLSIDDINVSRIPGSPPENSEPADLFLESVTYTAPYSLSLKSGRSNSARGQLNKKGLGGL